MRSRRNGRVTCVAEARGVAAVLHEIGCKKGQKEMMPRGEGGKGERSRGEKLESRDGPRVYGGAPSREWTAARSETTGVA